jgi:hypothetical protein
LDKNVAFGKELQSFQCSTVRAYKALPTLRELFFVADDIPNLDDVTLNVVLKNFDGLHIRIQSLLLGHMCTSTVGKGAAIDYSR